MEPIVLIGLIVVVYGGYIALIELWGDLSACFPRQTTRIADRFSQRGRRLKSPIKEMTGVHV